MTQWPPSADEFGTLPVGELRDRAQRRIAELEEELSQVRSFVQSVDRLSALVTAAPLQARTAHVPVAVAEGATVPERVIVALRAAGEPGMTARELTEAIFGPDANRSTLEGVRKAALRLVSRGLVSREDGKTYIAVEVSD